MNYALDHYLFSQCIRTEVSFILIIFIDIKLNIPNAFINSHKSYKTRTHDTEYSVEMSLSNPHILTTKMAVGTSVFVSCVGDADHKTTPVSHRPDFCRTDYLGRFAVQIFDGTLER